MENKLNFIVAIRNEDGLKTFKVNAIDYNLAEENAEQMAKNMNGILVDLIEM